MSHPGDRALNLPFLYRRMWADVARRVAVDVTLGALDAVARHFDIAPEELVLTGTAPVLDG